MFTASIKLANLQYLQALQQLALHNLSNMTTKPKLILLPFYNFVCKLVDILSQYCKNNNHNQNNSKNQQDEQYQYQYQANNFNSFLVDYYFRKYQSNSIQIYRQLFSFIRSWKKYTQHHQQARLFLSLLTVERNSKQSIRQFLKYRKCILKTINHKILQQIVITHEDALTITHTLFANNHDIKNYITKKINQMFISLKRKLINSAKINGAVMCQFFMACIEKYQEQNVNTIFQDTQQNSKIKSRLISSEFNQTKNTIFNNNKIKNKNQISEQLKYHNYTYTNQLNPQKIIDQHTNMNKTTNIMNMNMNNTISSNNKDIKYNLSFSQQYASYYSPQIQQNLLQNSNNNDELEYQNQNDNEEQNDNNNSFDQQQQQQNQQNQQQQNYQHNKIQQSEQWLINNCQNQQSPMLKIKNSLTFLKQKDKQIDQKFKIKMKKSIKYNQNSYQNQYNQSQSSTINKQNIVKYPKGWDKFIRTNEQTKRKIMKENCIKEEDYKNQNY